jgi:hypothetical protein
LLVKEGRLHYYTTQPTALIIFILKPPHQLGSFSKMSDYEDDDYEECGDWMYIEDEYLPADDLAEHAVASPPWHPLEYEDDEDIDRFEYFLDLEYGSDGYDDTQFYTHTAGSDKENTVRKRKRGTASSGKKKRQKVRDGVSAPSYPPVVWRAQADRDVEPKVVPNDALPESYALMKDWRERLVDLPAWPEVSSQKDSPVPTASSSAKSRLPQVSEPITPGMEYEDMEEGEAGVDEGALMAALQKNLAAAGGPLSNMDPQQLLQFAMRMMNDQGAGDDIAGELADDLLAGAQEEEDETEGDAPADLMDWLSKSRTATGSTASGATGMPSATLPMSPAPRQEAKQPPTPPSSEATRSYAGPEDADKKDTKKADHKDAKTANSSAFKQNNSTVNLKQQGPSTRKRKAEDDAEAKKVESAPKKRATRSFDAPTASSRAKAAAPAATATATTTTARTTRTTRSKRS